MKYYQITITSKNKQSLKNYFQFINEKIKNFRIINKNNIKEKKKKVVTILKSPHVNKKAQEQFESNFYFKQINLRILNKSDFFINLKKIETNLFSDVNIKIKLSINKNLLEKFRKKVFNPNNFKLNFFENLKISNNYDKITLEKQSTDNNKKELDNLAETNNLNKFEIKDLSKFKKTIKLFKIFDIYGEMTNTNLKIKY